MILGKTLLTPSGLTSLLKDYPTVKSSNKIEYLNIPCAFDIETTSFYQGDKKCACMYCFVFGLDGETIFGRTWEEFENILKTISKRYQLGKDKRLICYCHNFSYEFQWICKRLKWISVFASEERKPLKALSEYGIEFRCSYMLSGLGLEKTGENLLKYKVKKMVGDLDYSLMRHSKTPMTDKEIGYVWNDALVVMAFIQEEIERNKNNISLIPLTKTGYVRRLCKENCLYPLGHTKANVPHYYAYQKLISNLKMTSPQMYAQTKRAFHGGFTHTNSLASGVTQYDVTSFDFTSSYPYVLVAERYPMTQPKLVDVKSSDDFRRYIQLYCCVFDVTFVGIKARYLIDNPISLSKCYERDTVETDNGRVYQAKKISLTLTDVDYKVIRKFYTWEKMYIANMRVAMRQYLPTPFVKTILDLYEKKTTLKGVEGEEETYQKSKEMVNSMYGCTVTDIIQPENTFDEEGWKCEAKDVAKELDRYNNNKSRFLFYWWGVFCTAYAQSNLYEGIYEFGNAKDPELGSDYLYSDTDSVKVINAERHMDFIESYNKTVLLKLEKALTYHKLPLSLMKPKTIKGVEKPLGVWDFDGHYKRAKFLRAKCYLVEYDDGHRSLTVSGLNKKVAVPFMEKIEKFVKTKPTSKEIDDFCKATTSKWKRLREWIRILISKDAKDIFDLFSDDMYIPPEHTGKNIHTYIDDGVEGAMVDYLGNVGEFKELSYVHLEGCEYSLSITDEYIRFLEGVRFEKYG